MFEFLWASVGFVLFGYWAHAFKSDKNISRWLSGTVAFTVLIVAMLNLKSALWGY
jgi:hypothetical protein